MSSDLHQPLIIEARANELASAIPNANLPLGEESLVADALACQEAGASGYHWHARGEDGSDRPDDFMLHSRVIRGIRAKRDMLLHPSLGFTSTQGDVGARLAVIDELLARGDGPDIVPVDFGAAVMDRFDSAAQRFESTRSVLVNQTGYLADLVSAISERKIPILVVVWSPGGVRTALRLREAGLLSGPVYWQLGFTGSAIPGGPPATVRQLEAFLDELPSGEPWNVHVREGDGIAMAVEAVLRGGHVAIGLGDDPYERFGCPSNAEVVRKIADVAHTLGRSVATPAQAREILGFPIGRTEPVPGDASGLG